ncbi:regulatory protein cys-3 [Arthroderma uncinatum]|uniref:regulatory protein cys-3 n=1 Tax=Arthroderma uncinatum TaxID=74035 RepID=UPI00144AA83D|nr:regulatory protein cys-3 [Arthroderma uncinatum]KAF3491972.1 regulatory protein cys-3 [Arthroderma uncinatum]
MADFNGRRAPNFSQYLNELNTIPSPYEQTAKPEELFDVDAELALFTNAEFLDFDPAGNVKMDEQPVSGTVSPASGRQDMNYVEMLNDFNLPQFPYYQPQPPMVPVQSSPYPAAQPVPSNTIPQTAPAQQQPQQQTQPQPQPQTHTQLQTTQSTAQSQSTSVPSKRKPDAATAAAIDKADRLAQEEDKRRRNTAASARFRIKKKEREKNLEKTVKEVTTKNTTLESRVSQLEMENRWLRNLIVEKNGTALTEGDLSGMFHKYQESNGRHQMQKQRQASTTSPASEVQSSP